MPNRICSFDIQTNNRMPCQFESASPSAVRFDAEELLALQANVQQRLSAIGKQELVLARKGDFKVVEFIEE